MAQIEFFTDAVGTMFYREDGKTRELKDTEYGIITTMYGIIKSKFPLAYATLSSLYPDRLSIIKRFIACNLMNDDTVSFDLNESVINLEDVKCPLRGGLCKWEGIICRCKQQYDLNESDIRLLKMVKTGLEYADIAKQFGVQVDAIKKRMSRLKKLTGARNRFELINLYVL